MTELLKDYKEKLFRSFQDLMIKYFTRFDFENIVININGKECSAVVFGDDNELDYDLEAGVIKRYFIKNYKTILYYDKDDIKSILKYMPLYFTYDRFKKYYFNIIINKELDTKTISGGSSDSDSNNDNKNYDYTNATLSDASLMSNIINKNINKTSNQNYINITRNELNQLNLNRINTDDLILIDLENMINEALEGNAEIYKVIW